MNSSLIVICSTKSYVVTIGRGLWLCGGFGIDYDILTLKPKIRTIWDAEIEWAVLLCTCSFVLRFSRSYGNQLVLQFIFF